MFDKNAFIIKLDFFIRHYHSVGGTYVRHDTPHQLFNHMNILWAKACELLYITRREGVIQIGIGDKAEYEIFGHILSIGLNQLNTRLSILSQSNPNCIEFDIEKDNLIKEQVAALAEDIAELFTPTNVYNG